MKNTLYLLLSLTLLFSCEKKEENNVAVAYKIEYIGSGTPNYNVSYTDGGNTKSVGPVTSINWSSPTVITDYGTSVTFTLDAGNGSYVMRMYTNGKLWEEKTIDNPTGPVSIYTTLNW
jgi:hypothetical protein